MEVVDATQNSSKGFKMGRFAQWKWQFLQTRIWIETLVDFGDMGG